MIPKTTTQNLLLWAAALVLALLLSFLGATAKQLPGDDPINWRMVALDVITTITTIAPVVAAGFGLPRLGKESLAGLVSEVGAGQAKAALEVEAIRQQTGVSGLSPDQVAQMVAAVKASISLSDADIDRLAQRGIERLHEEGR